MSQTMIDFDGDTFDSAQDGVRLGSQLSAVSSFLARRVGAWLTLSELSQALGYPEASISARLRDLRKEKFGGYEIARRRAAPGGGTWEYSLVGKLGGIHE